MFSYINNIHMVTEYELRYIRELHSLENKIRKRYKQFLEEKPINIPIYLERVVLSRILTVFRSTRLCEKLGMFFSRRTIFCSGYSFGIGMCFTTKFYVSVEAGTGSHKSRNKTCNFIRTHVCLWLDAHRMISTEMWYRTLWPTKRIKILQKGIQNTRAFKIKICSTDIKIVR